MQELLRAIEQAKPISGPEGLTSAEIGEATGRNERQVLRLLRLAIRSGVIVVDRAPRRTIIGSIIRVPVYRPADNGVPHARHAKAEKRKAPRS